ncbi:hypothetical protein ADILRU_1577 [Leifsonia rubra CMS 76R]|nr:hypothetical protein ADILRU_1577 [Leifsonia rubra CMS 76R]
MPRYTFLVPVFKEANIVAQLVRNLRSIDWPTNRLVIFDAEDTPESDQLKKACISFQRGGEKTVCPSCIELF